MSRWRWKLLSTVALLMVLGCFWPTSEKEPVYQGRPLSWYLDSIRSSQLHYVRRVCERPEAFSKLNLTAEFNNPETLDAVSAVGTNALRLLLLRDPVRAPGALFALQTIRLEREDEIAALTNVFQIPASAAVKRPFDWMQGVPVEWVQGVAIIELLTYGTKARGALPVLIAVAQSTNSWHQGLAALALARIGALTEQAVPVIVAHLANTKTPVIPNEDPPSAASCAYALLVENVRLNVVALGEFGRPAAAGLPSLRRFHDEVPRDLLIQESTEWAIARIQR